MYRYACFLYASSFPTFTTRVHAPVARTLRFELLAQKKVVYVHKKGLELKRVI